MDALDPGREAPASQFFETPGNPVPDHARSGFLAARDGRKIRYALFGATGRPLKGTVIVLAGRNECIEKYFETIRDLAARGFATAMIDWRGQGASDRLIRNPEKGYVRDFKHYVADLEAFFAEIVLPDCRGPFYVLAHSTGALVALLAAPAMANRVQRMVLCAPLLGLPGRSNTMKTERRAAAFFYRLGLGSMYLGSHRRPLVAAPFAGNMLTTDPDRYRRNCLIYETHPRLALGGPTVAWVRAACRARDYVHDPEFMARLRIPTLFIAAGNDSVVSTRAIENYARQLKWASVLTIDGARHEMLQEADYFREQFLAAFDAFVPGSEQDIL
ncbi:MAG TPA: alpha/beta hydrolase [Rhizobiaceae bacterium]|nr:alpha/beta hydrolase [Rhizobiaceae bacterium]